MPRLTRLLITSALLAAVVPAAPAIAAELVWQASPPALTDFAWDPDSVAFGQGGAGRVGFTYTADGSTAGCWIELGTGDRCDDAVPGPRLLEGIDRSSSGSTWYAELGPDHLTHWQAPDGRTGTFPPDAGGETHIYSHDDGSADLSWYSTATKDWRWGEIGKTQLTGAPAASEPVATAAGNHGLLWKACSSSNATWIFARNGAAIYAKRGFAAPSSASIYTLVPGASRVRLWCQTLPDGVVVAASYVIADGTEHVALIRLADSGKTELKVTLARSRNAGALVDSLVSFVALGTRWYLVSESQASASDTPIVYYRGSDDAGLSWSDWSELADPQPTSDRFAVNPDERLVWLAAESGYSLWAYPAVQASSDSRPPADVTQATITRPEIAPACTGGATVEGLPTQFACNGAVLVKPKGKRDFVPLTDSTEIAPGSIVDARKASVTVTIAYATETRTGTFAGGMFRLAQSAPGAPATLTLTGALACGRRAKVSVKPRETFTGKPKRRRLWADAHGGFRTRGDWAAATELGTRWLTEDTCRATRVAVARGSVRVRDLRLKRTKTVRAGHSYVAVGRR